MPTKKQVFMFIRDKLKTSISAINNNVFPAYPLKEPQYPFVVLDIVGKNVEEYNLPNEPISTSIELTITLYTTTKEKADEISEQIENLINTEDIFGSLKEVSTLSSFQEVSETQVVYETPIKVTLIW